MKYASHCALLSAGLLGIAYACATPQELTGCQPGTSSADCDIILALSSDFDGDASVAQGGSIGGPLPGGSGSGSGSAGTGSSPPPSGGAAGTGSTPPPTGGSTGQGAAGSGQSAGAGGASGGAAGSGAAGAVGAAGSGAAGSGAAGTTGTAGAGGTTAQSNFNPAACNFTNRAGCETKACATVCSTNDGNYCAGHCQDIITCVAATTPTCATVQDPMCGTPFTTPTYRENECTTEVNSSGSTATAGTPANVALALINCLCDDTRL